MKKEQEDSKNKKEKALSKIDEKNNNKIKKFFKKVFEILSKKWLINGATTLLLVAIIIAIYMGVTTLLDKVTLPEIDCTAEKVYSLSDETKTKISAVDKDVKITLINYGDNDTMKSTIDKYKALNDKITIDRIDKLEDRQDIMQKYSLTATDTLIVVESGDKSKTIAASDLSTYDYSTYEEIDTTEEAITNAIVNVVTETKPKVYFMSNHVEYNIKTYYSTIEQAIEDDANEVDTVDLLTSGKVPDDCDSLVITTLKEDLTEPEKNYITDYINKGGKLLLLCGPSLSENVSLPNFQEILNLYGLSIESGVIFEGNSNNMLGQYPDIIVEEVTANSTTKNLDMNLKACFIDAAAIQTTTDSDTLSNLGVQYETLISTTSSAFVRTNLTNASSSRTSSDSEEGQYTIGVLATKKISDDISSKLILYSDEAFDPITMNGYSIPAYNNKDIVANSVAYLNQRENTITIRKNTNSVTAYSLTKQQENIVNLIIFLTPVAIIIIGIIVWQIRRKKNK